jgi:TolB-like protein/Flp pilus assembly protein TadD
MKVCPVCQRTYGDATLNFCRIDGAILSARSGLVSEDQTNLVNSQTSQDLAPTRVFPFDVSSGIAPALSPPAAPAQKRISRKSVDSLAVMPLVNESQDPNMDYLSDGITESIINSLSQLPQLRVMARSTVFRYKGQAVDPQDVGNRLGVRAVLTGRVLHIADRLIVKTELVYVTDGSQLWGEQYNRHLSDIVSVQEEISKEISEKLRLRLSDKQKRRLTKRHTQNTEAYHLYLKGRYHWNKRTDTGLTKSIQFLLEAVAQDPNYALAYAGLADSYNILGYYGYLSPREAFSKAKVAAVKALEIDDGLAEAHNSLAFVRLLYDWDWQDAERQFKRALKLNPGYATAHHWYAEYLAAMGRPEEALAEMQCALELDPLSLIINTLVGWVYYRARNYDQAIIELQKTLDMDPNFVPAHLFLGWTYQQKGLYKEAIAQFKKAQEFSESGAVVLAGLGHVYAISGQSSKARKVLAELKQLSRNRFVSPYDIALIYVGLGEKEKAFEWLEKAYESRSEMLVWSKIDPMLDALRTDSRFVNLMERIGLTA